jgi:YVTN family beta-propeller protein
VKVFALRALVVMLAGVGSLPACSGDAGFSAYEGDAYPNRRPRLEAADHTLAYVANRLSDSVSVVDVDTQKLLGNAPVGRDPVDTDGPRHVVLDPTLGLAYVVYSYPEVIVSPHASSVGSNGRLGYVAALELADLRPLGELRLDVSPAALALTSDGRALAVAHYDTVKALEASPPEALRANVAFVEPARGLTDSTAQAARVSVCAAPAAIAFAKNDTRLFVACSGEDSLVVLDAIEHVVLSRVPTGDGGMNQPYALARDSEGERLLVSNQSARTVVMFSADDTPEALSTATLPGNPSFAEFSEDGSSFVVALQNPDGSARVEAESGTVLASKSYTEEECLHPSQPKRLRDGRWVLICQGDGHARGALVQLNPETLDVIQPVTLGVLPERVELLEP